MVLPDKSSERDRFRFLDRGSLRVILLDFEGIRNVDEGLAAIAKARTFVAAQKPDGSHYTLTDVRNTHFDRRIIEAMKEFTEHNRPYVRAAAVVSNSTLHRAAIRTVAMLTRRNLQVFDTREAALAYLEAEHKRLAK